MVFESDARWLGYSRQMLRASPPVGFALFVIAAGCDANKTSPSNEATPCTPAPVASAEAAPAPIIASAVPAACLDALPRVLDASGNVDPTLYQALAAKLGRADGIAFRYGPDATCVQGGPPRAPLSWAAPHKPCNNGNPGYGAGYTYEVGGTCNDDAGYGSTQGPVVFDADKQESDGVDWIQYMGYGFNVMQYRPMPSWTWGGRARAPFFTNQDALAAHGGLPFAQPVSVGRSAGNFQTENDQGAMIGFADGALRCLGTNTGYCTASGLQLPKGKIPIAVAATGESEFTLYLVWDVATQKAELGVMAMLSNAALGTPGKGSLYGFIQGGNWKAGKLLGFIPLPDLKVPTALAANSSRGADGGWHDAADKAVASNNKLDMTDEPTRQTFAPSGFNSLKIGVGGFAMVASKFERKVTFVDLQPLFDYFNGKYFGTRADFELTQNDAGNAPSQWPHAFEFAPQSKPVVLATMPFDDMPTAVYAGFVNPGRKVAPLHAVVATMNGKLHQFDVGGLLDAKAAVAAGVRILGSIDVGRNVTSIVQSKHDRQDSSLTDLVMASRGDREIQFVTYRTGTGAV